MLMMILLFNISLDYLFIREGFECILCFFIRVLVSRGVGFLILGLFLSKLVRSFVGWGLFIYQRFHTVILVAFSCLPIVFFVMGVGLILLCCLNIMLSCFIHYSNR